MRVSLPVRLAVLGVPLLVALLVRLPFLATIPRYTDESLEVTWSLQVLRGEGLPLTNYDAYYGALFNYLVAGVFAVTGPDAAAARAISLVAGVLTVGATCLLGRAWGGPLAGLIAGLLLALNGAHAAINSHVAWANCLTPLFTTLAAWAVWRGAESPRWLVAAGLLFGLALQTHPMVVLMLPAAALFVAWRAPRALRTPWPYLAVVALLLGYGNMVAHNLANHFESITTAALIRREYGLDQDAAPGYPQALAAELLLLGRVLAGAVDARPAPWGFLVDPLLWGAAALAAAGLVVQARRGNWLPALLAVSFLLLLPAFNPKFRTLITSRYLMPLVPVLLACVGAVVAVSVERGAWSVERGAWQYAPRSTLHALTLLVGLAMLVVPPVHLGRYYARAIEQGETNDRAYSFASLVAQHRRPGEPLVLDESFGSERGGGDDELRALTYLLTLRGVQVTDLKLTARRLQEELGGRPSLLTILTGRQVREMERLRLAPLGPPPERPGAYGLYRLEGVGP